MKNCHKVNLQDDDFGAILNCAVRYSMGRRTYMPHLVVSYISPLLPELTDKTLWCFERDLSSPAIYGGLGDETIDGPMWLNFHELVKKEITKRKELNTWKLRT